MGSVKKSEKLFLKNIVISARELQKSQRGLDIGQLIALIRGQLGMSQRALSARAKVPQATISKVESRSLQPNLATLEKLLKAMDCELLVSFVPRKDFGELKKEQAMKIAEHKINYLRGTMSLEKQMPNKEFFKEIFDEEVNSLLNSPSSRLWEE
ncbi:MAG: helix-turn-helix domain-containing protein [Chlamydiia bacterium]|nr:helix-turn-helix domain-containing protein [Chlamydiia bacterium]